MTKNTNHNKSHIFSDKEFEALYKRANGSYEDKYGRFSNRIRPKIQEILAWNTPRLRKLLKKCLEQKRRTVDDTPAEPMQIESFDKFKSEIGY